MRGAPPRIYYKMAFYLDPLSRESGALRVIPGSHRWGDAYAESLESQIRKSGENWGIEGWKVPAVALETQPGDIVVFNQNTKHSAWGGSDRRRMFTVNCTARFAEMDMQFLKNEIAAGARFWLDSVYGEAMLEIGRSGAHEAPGAGPGAPGPPGGGSAQGQGADGGAVEGLGRDGAVRERADLRPPGLPAADFREKPFRVPGEVILDFLRRQAQHVRHLFLLPKLLVDDERRP